MRSTPQDNFSGKRLVVLGCGYVGSAVAREAVARGLTVTALTRNAERATELTAGGVECVVASLADDAWHGRIAGGADFVLNCVSAGGGGVAGYRESYGRGMESVIAWSRARGPAGAMVYTSSTSVYAQDAGVVDEAAALDRAGERAGILVEAEELLRHATDAAARRVVLRVAGIYGPGRHHLLDQLRAGATELPGRGEHRLNLAHRDDIVTAVWAAFGAEATDASETFNVADDAPAPKAEVVAWLAARIGVAVPRFTGEAGGGRRERVPDRVVSNARLKAALGWAPRYPSFRDGYEKILSS